MKKKNLTILVYLIPLFIVLTIISCHQKTESIEEPHYIFAEDEANPDNDFSQNIETDIDEPIQPADNDKTDLPPDDNTTDEIPEPDNDAVQNDYDDQETEDNENTTTADEDSIQPDEDATQPPDNNIKIFILAGQSNMVGTGTIEPTQAHLDRNGGKGTLRYLVEDQSQKPTFDHLINSSGEWSARDDVWLIDLDSSGPLTAEDKTTFGPELQFGHVLGDFYDNQVIIIKIAWGGKSLYEDFRPPSSGGEVGPYYTLMIDRVHEVLNNIGELYPDYDGSDVDIVGFGWHQGWNDRINQTFNDAYQENCVNLINDLRDEFNIPDMPFVLATTGMSGWNETHPRALSLMEAQLAVPRDERLENETNVSAVETRDFWRDETVSPANQGYHWNRNAETYFLIGNAMGEHMIDILENSPPEQNDEDTIENPTVHAKIDAVFFAQTHVLRPNDELFKLVSNRNALIKAHIISSTGDTAPEVTAELTLGDTKNVITLTGPANLPESINIEPGVVEHTFDDSFTGVIPKEWVKPGLIVKVTAGDKSITYDNLKIGAPNKVVMTMFDVHYFSSSPGDYDEGWKEELQEKWPVSEIELRRISDVIFEELVIPPRNDVKTIAARVKSKTEYQTLTGQPFDGEQAAALQWKSALKAAAGYSGRVSLYYINIYGVWAGGQAGGFGGVGNGTSEGILNHELGHALSLPHWGNNQSYPYRGEMYGIPAPESDVHVGPTWAFDVPSMTFIPPTVQENSVGGTVGTYKKDPMQGGGVGDQEEGFIYRHFSDYSVNKMRNYLENHIVRWNSSLNSYASWNDTTKNYKKTLSNNGVQFPIERDVEVISVMAGVSAVTPQANIVYKPIGPYITGLIELFDPTVEADRTKADQIFCPDDGCDVSLKIVQGGVTKTFMLPIAWDTTADPRNNSSYKTKAVNLRASDGEVTKAELLFTPDAEKNGLPGSPDVLYTWSK